jgi:predicted transcriptional regulator
MKLSELTSKIEGKVITGHSLLENEVEYAFASDLMSDVLTVDKEDILLITGLNNLQTIRTAEMADIRFIIFARNKKVNCDIKELAEENNIAVIECPWSVFKTSGVIYQLGIKPLF